MIDLRGIKFIRWHFGNDWFANTSYNKLEETYSKMFHFDTGSAVGTHTFDWQLDFMPSTERKALLTSLEHDLEIRGWKAMKSSPAHVEIYTAVKYR